MIRTVNLCGRLPPVVGDIAPVEEKERGEGKGQRCKFVGVVLQGAGSIPKGVACSTGQRCVALPCARMQQMVYYINFAVETISYNPKAC